jgi:hypothetical protein
MYKLAKTTARGYGNKHQREKARLRPTVDAPSDDPRPSCTSVSLDMHGSAAARLAGDDQ